MSEVTGEKMTAVVKYDVTDATIADLKERYTGLTISDREGYDHVRKAIGEVVTLRTGVEKMRKALKADALEWGRRVDAEAKRITAELLSIEQPLKATKKEVDDRKAAEKAEKERIERERVEGIKARIQEMNDAALDLEDMKSEQIRQVLEEVTAREVTKEHFAEFTEHAEAIKAQAVQKIGRALVRVFDREKEQAELAAAREKLEQERKAREEAEAKIEAERRAKEEAERKIRQEAEAKIEAERKAKEAAERELLEQKQAEERRKAEAETRAKEEAEAKAVAEKQARIEAERKLKEEQSRGLSMRPGKGGHNWDMVCKLFGKEQVSEFALDDREYELILRAVND